MILKNIDLTVGSFSAEPTQTIAFDFTTADATTPFDLDFFTTTVPDVTTGFVIPTGTVPEITTAETLTTGMILEMSSTVLSTTDIDRFTTGSLIKPGFTELVTQGFVPDPTSITTAIDNTTVVTTTVVTSNITKGRNQFRPSDSLRSRKILN